MVRSKTKFIALVLFFFSFHARAQDLDIEPDPDLDRAMCFVSQIYSRHQSMNYLLGSGSILTAGTIAFWIQKESVKETWVEKLNTVLRGNIAHQLNVSPSNNLTYFLSQSMSQRSQFFSEMISTYRATHPEALGIGVFRNIPEITSMVHTFEMLLPNAREAYADFLHASQEPEMLDLTKKSIFETLTHQEEKTYEEIRKKAWNNLMKDERYINAKKIADLLDKKINTAAFRLKVEQAIYAEYGVKLLNNLERGAATLQYHAVKAQKAFRNFDMWRGSVRVIGLSSAALIIAGVIVGITNGEEYRTLTNEHLPSYNLHEVRNWLDDHRDTLNSVLLATANLPCN